MTHCPRLFLNKGKVEQNLKEQLLFFGKPFRSENDLFLFSLLEEDE